MSVVGQSLNLLGSILIILLTCPNSDTLLYYCNKPFLTIYGRFIKSWSNQPSGAITGVGVGETEMPMEDEVGGEGTGVAEGEAPSEDMAV